MANFNFTSICEVIITILVFAVFGVLIGAGVVKVYEFHFLGEPIVCLGVWL